MKNFSFQFKSWIDNYAYDILVLVFSLLVSVMHLLRLESGSFNIQVDVL